MLNNDETVNWHVLTGSEILTKLGVDLSQGLSADEATARLDRYGHNELTAKTRRGPLRILLEQLTSTMVVVLIIAAVVSAFVGDYKDSMVIMAIVVLNAALGFLQDFRAEKTLESLRKYAAPGVKVLRSGQWEIISSRLLVPGDVVLLEMGNIVPADSRVVESHNLRIQESALTGESQPVEKDPDSAAMSRTTALADRTNMVFMGTTAAYGRGIAVVTQTGNTTELGRIAKMIGDIGKETTPLQRRMDQLGRNLAVIAGALVFVIFIAGLLQGEEIKLMFLTGVSLAVAAIPEGLPAVVTIALALGAQRMLKRNALLRRLPAVETLGSVTVICSDKTGTLTQDKMTVTAIDLIGERIEITKDLPNPDKTQLTLLLAASALCNDAVLQPAETPSGTSSALGDPTEIALLAAAANFGLRKEALEDLLPRIEEVPFSSERKRMTTLHELKTEIDSDHSILTTALAQLAGPDHLPYVAFTKGAVDGLLNISAYRWGEKGPETLDREWLQRCRNRSDELAAQGMRVLGIAAKPVRTPGGKVETVECDLVFLGMAAMIDPPRQEARDAVKMCRDAGIRPVMITGDHPLTAKFIAGQVGIDSGAPVLTGADLDSLQVKQNLEETVAATSVFARVSPHHKLLIIEALQKRRHVVAMTGDGVNDAPALKKADIGVAMGSTGTDVAKEASDMVLLDDNFASIVAAVGEGRVIYDNIRKFIRYILTTNSGELWVMLFSSLLGMPLALLPLQILWINLVTDGLPALALTLEPAERDVMQRPPQRPDEGVFSRGLGWHILWVGLLMGVLVIAAGYHYWSRNKPEWQTLVFATVTFTQMAHVMAIRSERDAIFKIGLLSNKPLLGAVTLTFLSQLATIYVPFLQAVFHTRALSVVDMAIALTASAVIFHAVEFEKWFRYRRSNTGH